MHSCGYSTSPLSGVGKTFPVTFFLWFRVLTISGHDRLFVLFHLAAIELIDLVSGATYFA